MGKLIVAVDLDFERLPFNRAAGSKTPPEAGLAHKAGLVWFRDTPAESEVVDADVLTGPGFAARLVRELSRADMVIGHGLLTCDLRALSMVTPVPDTLADNCVDTLEVVHSLVRRAKARRGLVYPTGMGLSALAAENTTRARAKPPAWQAETLPQAQRRQALADAHRNTSPVDDAELVIAVREAMLRAGRVRVGGPRWEKDGQAEYPLDEIAVAQLRGHRPGGASEWRRRIAETGDVLHQVPRNDRAARLFQAGTETHRVDLAPLRDIWARLSTSWPMGEPTPERLLSALQYLGAGGNLAHRRALLAGRYTKAKNRGPEYALAAWLYARPDFPAQVEDRINHGEWEVIRRGVAGAARTGQSV